MILTAFGGKDEDCTNDHVEPNFESLWFQLVRSGETKKDEKSYNAKIEILLRELKKYYEINENDANLLIDCPRVGQPCAVQYKKVKTPGAQGRDKAEERPEYYRGNYFSQYFYYKISDFNILYSFEYLYVPVCTSAAKKIQPFASV